jgi:hypothetical protein
LERLQWWYQLSPAKEKALGDSAPETLRAEAIARFRVHIQRWLQNTRQDLFGDGAIPHVCAEGNRVVAAYRVDPGASDGMLQDDETQQAGDSTPTESDHLPANKTAFG